MNYDEFDPTYSEQIWDDAEEWERDRLAEDNALEAAAEPCETCAGARWIDVHDAIGCADDLRAEHEVIGGRIHVPCRDCNTTGAPF